MIQELECTCEVDCQVESCCGLTSHKIIHGPCHAISQQRYDEVVTLDTQEPTSPAQQAGEGD